MAVTLADLRTRVGKVLKRGSVTNAELDEFITDAVRRIQRTLRTPLDLASSEATVPENWNGRLAIPGNLLNLHSIQCDGVELEMRAVSDVKRAQKRGGPALMFCVEVDAYLIAPMPKQGSKLTVIYTADAYGPLTSGTMSLKLFDVAADLVMYGALIRAADWSLDDNRLAKWNSMYNALFIELQDMADRDDYNNAVVNTRYTTNGDWY